MRLTAPGEADIILRWWDLARPVSIQQQKKKERET